MASGNRSYRHGPDQKGVHVNGGDPVDIAWGIKETLMDPDRAKKWGENGRKRVIQYFTWREAAEQTLQIYEKLCSKEKEESGPAKLPEIAAKA